MRLPRDVRTLIRDAMGHVSAWKRQEVADTVITLRKAGKLSIREIALAVDRSERHVKRVLADAGLSKGAAASQPRPTKPAAPEPTVTSPPQPDLLAEDRYQVPEPPRRKLDALEQVEEWRQEQRAALGSGTRLDEIAREKPKPAAQPNFTGPGRMVMVNLDDPRLHELSYLDKWALNLGSWEPAPLHPHDAAKQAGNFRPVDDEQWRLYRKGGL